MDSWALLTSIGPCIAFALALGAVAEDGRGWSSSPALVRWLRFFAVAGTTIATVRFALIVAGWLRPESPANIYDFEVF